ncbi:hypothetical protein H4582DRAFT_2103531 [Lactarius indigo]|nr:hypothetical protein H4582DRAFT_2103531 [Lactarius indigo]
MLPIWRGGSLSPSSLTSASAAILLPSRSCTPFSPLITRPPPTLFSCMSPCAHDVCSQCTLPRYGQRHRGARPDRRARARARRACGNDAAHRRDDGLVDVVRRMTTAIVGGWWMEGVVGAIDVGESATVHVGESEPSGL